METQNNVFSEPAIVTALKAIELRSIEMKHHRVFGLLHSIDDLRIFMSWHAFAVWDFMSLVKRLQLEFTTVSVPWTPPRNAETARLINEIVLGEETDLARRVGYSSHYDLYVAAMGEVGANTNQIKTFTDLVASNMPTLEALKVVDAPVAVQNFVVSNVELAMNGSVEQVLGSFVYGREDAIPEMFQSLLETWRLDQTDAPTFVYYLQRHIHLDADEHGPAAMRMLAEHVAGDIQRLTILLKSALSAIEQRIEFWNALAETLVLKHAEHDSFASVV